HGNIIAIEQKETYKDENGKRYFNLPLPNFRSEAKKHLEQILISYKTKNKVVTRNKNKIKGSSKVQIALTPRGQMHKETVYGKIQQYATKEIKIGPSCDIALLNQIANKKYRDAVLNRLQQFDNDPNKAFGGKNALTKNPILLVPDKPMPEKVKIVVMEDLYTIRKEITPDLVIDKVIDVQIKRILQQRLIEYNNDPKAAFSNLDKNPIWMNKEKGISIKRVTISGVSNAEALHYKKDHTGKPIFDAEGNYIPADFVSTGNNHHVAIYRDESGNLQEEVVSFYEAVARVNAGMPIIKKQHENGWQFLFTMKQNEMFVFPSTNFDPTEIDLLNPDNYHLISPNLFRVQKFSKVIYGNSAVRDYVFRHHLETTINDNKQLKDIAYKSIKSLSFFERIIKVRINHLGRIVQVGEY
ncbi:MAG TPA: type II CRISPR RNA-guided endonuclease Cas9, partial [Bacteroidales bacterium]|nr:type II CRISPR RNA-guided endonuclease Cas9 [Bacteroidales bacterium]